MKICLAQLNVCDAEPEANSREIILAARKGAEQGAALCIVPGQALFGPNYQPFCPDYDPGCKYLTYIAMELERGPSLLCGSPYGSQCAYLVQNGIVVGMPDVFFLDGQTFYICDNFSDNNSCPDADFFIAMSAAAYAPGAQMAREENFVKMARDRKQWLLAPNLAGGCGQLVYNGQSLVIDPHGRRICRGKAFEPDLLLADTDSPEQRLASVPDENEAQWQALVTGVRDFFRKSGKTTALIGLSGGMDSAIVACIAAAALGPEHVQCVLMPSPYTSAESLADAELLAKNLGISLATIPIEKLMAAFSETLEPVLKNFPARPGDTTLENIQARIRGVLLMALANRNGALVLNTGNRSEAAMGYCTLYGDTAGALAVIGDIFKTRIYELAEWYTQKYGPIIPRNIIDRPPSAELRPNQKDTDSLPPYSELDPALAALFACDLASPCLENFPNLAKTVRASEFKRRQSPPPLLVG